MLNIIGIWALKPYYLGPWTLSATHTLRISEFPSHFVHSPSRKPQIVASVFFYIPSFSTAGQQDEGGPQPSSRCYGRTDYGGAAAMRNLQGWGFRGLRFQ